MSALPTHVILKMKRDSSGIPCRFKARVVESRHMQVPGREFDVVYAYVVEFSKVLLVLDIALQYDWCTGHIDFKTAFLNGYMDRDIYVPHPENLLPGMRNNTCTLRAEASAFVLVCQASHMPNFQTQLHTGYFRWSFLH